MNSKCGERCEGDGKAGEGTGRSGEPAAGGWWHAIHTSDSWTGAAELHGSALTRCAGDGRRLVRGQEGPWNRTQVTNGPTTRETSVHLIPVDSRSTAPQKDPPRPVLACPLPCPPSPARPKQASLEGRTRAGGAEIVGKGASGGGGGDADEADSSGSPSNSSGDGSGSGSGDPAADAFAAAAAADKGQVNTRPLRPATPIPSSPPAPTTRTPLRRATVETAVGGTRTLRA